MDEQKRKADSCLKILGELNKNDLYHLGKKELINFFIDFEAYVLGNHDYDDQYQKYLKGCNNDQAKEIIMMKSQIFFVFLKNIL